MSFDRGAAVLKLVTTLLSCLAFGITDGFVQRRWGGDVGVNNKNNNNNNLLLASPPQQVAVLPFQRRRPQQHDGEMLLQQSRRRRRQQNERQSFVQRSTLEAQEQETEVASNDDDADADAAPVTDDDEDIPNEFTTSSIVNGLLVNNNKVTPLSSEEVASRLEKQLEKLRKKDTSSPTLSKEDLVILYEDEHIIMVNKPPGVLCVPTRDGEIGNLADSVYDAFGCEMQRSDMMVVHRLGMDTSGIVIFAKTMMALRGMNTVFRTRKIERVYEALVCGHIAQDSGVIELPLMRDYEFPPYMRVATFQQQMALIDLDPEIVGKRLFERPKKSITKYEVMNREELEGHSITRVALTSVSGRTHQLNVHMATFGHPIVGDVTYGGMNCEAAPNGGLFDDELAELIPNDARVDAKEQDAIAMVSKDGRVCIHAKSVKFRHPVTKEDVYVTVDAPF